MGHQAEEMHSLTEGGHGDDKTRDDDQDGENSASLITSETDADDQRVDWGGYGGGDESADDGLLCAAP